MSARPDVRPDVPAHRYDGRVADEIETRWQAKWDADGTYHTPNPTGPLADGFDAMRGKPKTFVLDMFPYPSGDGLHVGHPLGFIGTDVYARYLRMTGHNVLHTMGFDAFGLPAEQYAVQTGQHPRITTEANVANYRRQLHRLGLGHDPRRSISTTDVTYYRWTQWIFLKIFNSWYDIEAKKARPIDELVASFESGARAVPDGRDWEKLDSVQRREVVDSFRLAYLDEAPVNWCPGLGTVLANEEVTSEGRSDRGNFPVFKRPLKQWKMRITAYADRLIDDLAVLDWPEPIKVIQRNWIGRSDGALIHFPAPSIGEPITVFTTLPRHHVRRDVHGACSRASARRRARTPGMARWHAPEVDGRRGHAVRRDRELPPHRGIVDGRRASGRVAPEDRRLHRRVRDEPRNQRVDPGVRRRLRADGLWHRGDHGGARSGRARLGVRRGVRPADRAHRAAARRLGGQGLRRRGARDQQWLPRRARRRGRKAQDHRVARAERLRRGHGHVPAPRLAVQPAALLGRAVPDHLRRHRSADRRPRVDAARAAP